MEPRSARRADAAAESRGSVDADRVSAGTPSCLLALNLMERRDDGDEPVGTLNSAQEPGKSADLSLRI